MRHVLKRVRHHVTCHGLGNRPYVLAGHAKSYAVWPENNNNKKKKEKEKKKRMGGGGRTKEIKEKKKR